jgi:predicted RND superfamily exporter protein
MSLLVRFAELLLRFRGLLLLVCAVLVGLAIAPSLQLDFDRSIESLFRADDPRYENYREDKRLFGGLETSLVAYDDPQLFTTQGLRRLERLGKRLSELAGVKGVLSLATVRRPTDPWDPRPLADQLSSGDVTADALREELLNTKLYRGRLVSGNGRTTVLLVELAPVAGDSVSRAEVIEQVREICAGHDPPAVFLGGPVLVDDVFRHLEEDGVTLGLASSLILMLVIAVLFRNLRWIVLPLAVVHVALIWTKALLVESGMQMSMVSSPLVALVTVIGVATVVHVTIRFREERLQAEPRTALRETLVHIIPAIFWTCLTTAAGFGALLASSVSPVKSFGTMMALGSALVFFATIGLTPGVALSMRFFSTDPARAPGEGKLAAALERIVAGVERHPWRVGAAALALVGFTSLGIFRMQVATDFTDNFRQSSPIVQSYEFLSERLESVNTLDVLVDVPDVMSADFETTIDQLRALQADLEKEDAIVDTLSVVDLLDFLPGAPQTTDEQEGPTTAGGLLGWIRKIPAIPKRAELVMLDIFEPGLVAGFWNREEHVARILVQIREVHGAEGKTQLVERIEAVSRERFPSARTAGIFVLLTYVVQSLLADQWITFALSLASIFVMMTVAFRSARLGLAALLPNAAPIVMVLGTMGWIGLKINMATAMLASVSMGLAVDFSIHYLYRFHHELQGGKEFFAAMRDAHGSVGLAMVMANLALIAGFLVLVISSFIPTVHFGILVSVAMLGGLAGNLIVLPLILRLLWHAGSFRNLRGPDKSGTGTLS